MAFALQTGTAAADYGYLLLALSLTPLVNAYHSHLTSRARKAAKIAYPTAYATTAEADKDPLAKRFNCAQRAHANFTENLTPTLASFVVSGVEFPKFTAACTAIWLAGRIVYARGYASGEPQKRMYGGFAYLGTLGALFGSFYTSYKLIAGAW